MLAIESAPEIVPAEEGAKVKVAVADWPALMTVGELIPLRVKAEPDIAMEETDRSAFPELLIVTLPLPLLPTGTEPKFTLALLALI